MWVSVLVAPLALQQHRSPRRNKTTTFGLCISNSTVTHRGEGVTNVAFSAVRASVAPLPPCPHLIRESVNVLIIHPCEHPVHDPHLVLRQRPRLVRADVGGVAHGLAGGEVPDEVVVLEHLLGGEGEGDGHGEGEALGDGNDHDGHGDYEGLEDGVEPGAFDFGGARADGEQPDDHERREGGAGGCHPHVPDQRRHVVQLLLQRGLRLLALEASLDDAPLRVAADGGDEHVAGALGDVAAGEHEGVRASGTGVVALEDTVYLSSEGRLVLDDSAGVAQQQDAVGRDLVSRLEEDDVADDYVAGGQLVSVTVAEYLDVLGVGGDVLEVPGGIGGLGLGGERRKERE